MANPNIVTSTSIYGLSTSSTISTTSVVGIVTNSSGSNKVLKINTIRASNVDGVSSADISVGINIVGSSTTQYLARTISVPPDASLVVVDKNSSFYLLENHRIVVQASSANDIDAFFSWEEIS
jgi:hypothetical protein